MIAVRPSRHHLILNAIIVCRRRYKRPANFVVKPWPLAVYNIAVFVYRKTSINAIVLMCSDRVVVVKRPAAHDSYNCLLF
jgi:hypothetical protein